WTATVPRPPGLGSFCGETLKGTCLNNKLVIVKKTPQLHFGVFHLFREKPFFVFVSFQFLKSEADLEYIERRLKLDFINGASARGSFAKENVAGILENLKSIKAKHSLLRCQVSQITDAQKGSMELIRNRLSTAMELIKHCQQASHLEVESLAESEQESAMFLDSTITSITAEVRFLTKARHKILVNFGA
uniref:Protein FAM33A n=1 Tax=Poecilia formosa TaxID=48698 RepID=A0A096LZW4_POEFO